MFNVSYSEILRGAFIKIFKILILKLIKPRNTKNLILFRKLIIISEQIFKEGKAISNETPNVNKRFYVIM